jgi:hypothetical protein
MLSAKAREARAAQVRPVVRDSVVEEGWARFTVVLEPQVSAVAADTLSYLVQEKDSTWYVSLPLKKLTGTWTSREGRFIRLRVRRIVTFSKHALAAADAEIARIFEELEAPQAALVRLERIKLDYYLCDGEDDVRQLVGSLKREGYLPAAGRVVSRTLPDMQAIAPLLVQLALRQVPLHNEPVFEEGLPLALGGTNEVTRHVYLQRTRNANLDGERLGLAFEAGTPREDARPLEALWNRMLLNELGPAAFLDLYKASGEARAQHDRGDNARALSGIEKALGKRGEVLQRWAAESLAGIAPTVLAGWETWPQDIYGLQAFLRWRGSDEVWSIEGYEIDDRYVFVVGPYVPGPPQWVRDRVDSLSLEYAGEAPEWEEPPEVERPEGDPPPIFFLVRAKLEDDLEPYESRLFRELFLTRDYRNDLWGFLVTPETVQLFDFTQNKMIAEYSVETSPAGSFTYYDEEPGRICFHLAKAHFPRPLTAYYVFLGIYTGE